MSAPQTPDEAAWGADARPHPLDGVQTGASITVRLKDGRTYAGVAQLTANGHLSVHAGTEIHDVSPLDIKAVETAPQTPPPCPDGITWCTITHEHTLHRTRNFGTDAFVMIVQDLDRDLVVWVSTNEPKSSVVEITQATYLRTLADLSRQSVATALTEAADELDRITSGGAS